MKINPNITKELETPGSRLSKNINSKLAQKLLVNLSYPKKYLLPVILLESTVIAGRCYEAKKRGGEDEFRERAIEEITTSLIWLFGMKKFGDLFDVFSKKFFNIDTSIDLVPKKWFREKKLSPEAIKSAIKKEEFKNTECKGLIDWLKDPLDRACDGLGNNYKTKVMALKFAKVALSVVVPLYIIGTVLINFNQTLTRKLRTERKHLKDISEECKCKPAVCANSMHDFVRDIKFKNDPKTSNNVSKDLNNFITSVKKQSEMSAVKLDKPSFKGNGTAFDIVKTIGYSVENDKYVNLLVMDGGILYGRTSHARNEDEKREIIFRDAVSILFYMFSTPFIMDRLSKWQDGKQGVYTKLDPRIANYLNDKVIKDFKEKYPEGISKEELKKVLFGNDLYNIDPKREEQTEFEKFIEDLQANHKNKITIKDFKDKSKEMGWDITEDIKNIDKYPDINKQTIGSDIVMEYANKFKEQNNQKAYEKLKRIADEMYSKGFEGIIADTNELDIFIENILKPLKTKVRENLSEKEIKELNLIENFKSDLIKLRTKEDFCITPQIKRIKNGYADQLDVISESFKLVFSDVGKSHEISDLQNPKKYVSPDTLIELEEDINKYVNQLYKNIEKEVKNSDKVTFADIERIATRMKNKNSIFKILYAATGLGISAFFLSIVIPKIQYFITWFKTGKNEFPGVRGL